MNGFLVHKLLSQLHCVLSVQQFSEKANFGLTLQILIIIPILLMRKLRCGKGNDLLKAMS